MYLDKGETSGQVRELGEKDLHTPGKHFKEFGAEFVKEHGPVYFGSVGSTASCGKLL